jgi:hypothetical protein
MKWSKWEEWRWLWKIEVEVESESENLISLVMRKRGRRKVSKVVGQT